MRQKWVNILRIVYRCDIGYMRKLWPCWKGKVVRSTLSSDLSWSKSPNPAFKITSQKQHTKIACSNLMSYIIESNILIAMIQEPGLTIERLRSLIIMISVSSIKQLRALNLVVSSYFASDDPIPQSIIVSLTENVNFNEDDGIVIGCNASARCNMWGSNVTNERGQYLLDYINTPSLSICNRGNTPTVGFPSEESCVGWADVIDITLSYNSNLFGVRGWMTFSSPIQFVLGILKIRTGLNSVLYLKNILKSIKTKDNTPELLNLRRKLRSTLSSYKSKTLLRTYKKELLKAKRDSWRNFCESI
uniref:Endonuclease/exonuclease/phosphatase domain-containing protein n=1 Tax=Megaselia scalaris TaxID=36166 RepID=T1GHL4_MEGSC